MQLIAENLVLSRAGRTVVDGLSLQLGAGEALLLRGPNGSGKTTLLRALAGFLAPAAGVMRLDDAPAEREPGELAHFVGHLDGIKSHLTVAENLAFWADYLGAADDARVGAALDGFGLAPLADIPAGYLSAGQKRRLGARPPRRGAASALASRRADGFARCGSGGAARRGDRGAPAPAAGSRSSPRT